jgi:hypothetical protein
MKWLVLLACLGCEGAKMMADPPETSIQLYETERDSLGSVTATCKKGLPLVGGCACAEGPLKASTIYGAGWLCYCLDGSSAVTVRLICAELP